METQKARPSEKGNKYWFLKGIHDGIPIALGYFAVSIAMGITAKNIGMTVFQAALMSMLMLASAGQYAALTVIAAGSGYPEMIITTLIVNLRYLLMSCALSQKLESKTGLGHRLAMSYCVTDEIFGAASVVEGRLNPFYQYGMAAVAAPGWTAGTVLGAVLGAVLPTHLTNALNIALFGMFLAVIIPPAKKDKVIAVVVVTSMAGSCLFNVIPGLKEISSGFRIIILTLVIAGAAAYLRPVTEEE